MVILSDSLLLTLLTHYPTLYLDIIFLSFGLSSLIASDYSWLLLYLMLLMIALSLYLPTYLSIYSSI